MNAENSENLECRINFLEFYTINIVYNAKEIDSKFLNDASFPLAFYRQDKRIRK